MPKSPKIAKPFLKNWRNEYTDLKALYDKLQAELYGMREARDLSRMKLEGAQNQVSLLRAEIQRHLARITQLELDLLTERELGGIIAANHFADDLARISRQGLSVIKRLQRQREPMNSHGENRQMTEDGYSEWRQVEALDGEHTRTKKST